MDPALSAAYSQRVWTRALLVRLDLPGGVYCLTDGGFVVYGERLYLGQEPTLGLFVGVSGLTSGMGDQTTRVDLRIAPKNNAAASILGSPNAQGSRARIWRGAIDRSSGMLIGEPVLRFDGEVDQPRFSVGTDRTLTVACGTQSARQLEQNADWRANHSFHATRWGNGETGMIRVAGIAKITQDLGTWRT